MNDDELPDVPTCIWCTSVPEAHRPYCCEHCALEAEVDNVD